jgi:hypothetical protein
MNVISGIPFDLTIAAAGNSKLVTVLSQESCHDSNALIYKVKIIFRSEVV